MVAEQSTLESHLLARLIDVHCHPHDEPDYDHGKAINANIQANKVCCMSSNLYNQATTAELARAHPHRLIPCFGLHPWFCHPISFAQQPPSKQQHYAEVFAEQSQELTDDLLQALPDPLPVSDFLQTLRANLESHPNALLGEVGLDKTFKISSFGNHIAPHSVPERVRAERPIQWTNLKTPLTHQVAVLEAQIDLAIQLHRTVSLHCVQAQGAVSDLLARLTKKHGKTAFEGACRIDLHAFGGSAESVAQLQKKHKNVFFSFSIAINSRSPRLRRVIQSVDKDRLLLESDWPSFDEQIERLSEMVWLMADARGWSVEDTVGVLEANSEAFLTETKDQSENSRS